jgi:hypothetical protein
MSHYDYHDIDSFLDRYEQELELVDIELLAQELEELEEIFRNELHNNGS